MAGQSKKMAVEWMSFEQLKKILKWYRKSEKVWEVKRERCGVSCRGFMGLFFFEGTATCPMYLSMLQISTLPATYQLYRNEPFYYQQDGSPSRHHRDIRSYLDETQPDHWIGRRGSVEYPPRSGRAIAQAVSRRLPTAAARVQTRVWSSGICGGQGGAGAGFLRVLLFPLPIFIPPNSPSS
jgi:hypothetical protein